METQTMLMTDKVRRSIVLTLILLSSFQSLTLAQDKKKKEAPRGTPVLWKEPVNIRSRNLFLGPGGAAMRPDLRKLKFIEEEGGGYSTKYRVSDARGRVWVAKVGKEAQSETAAVRLLWAIGYPTEINYLVPRVEIPGKGVFENVRFEARPGNVERAGEWKWDENPFIGTREFQGLKVMMVLLNNWDIKDENNVILAVPGGRRGRNELQYAISDLGATFGKTGSLPLLWRITRSRNNAEDFAESRFIDKVKDDGRVDFRYGGKKRELFENVTVAQAKWIGGWLSRLSNQQISDAFRAANYDPSEVRMMTEAVRARINELVNLRGQQGRRASR
jgi:hypothetical protein